MPDLTITPDDIDAVSQLLAAAAHEGLPGAQFITLDTHGARPEVLIHLDTEGITRWAMWLDCTLYPHSNGTREWLTCIVEWDRLNVRILGYAKDAAA